MISLVEISTLVAASFNSLCSTFTDRSTLYWGVLYLLRFAYCLLILVVSILTCAFNLLTLKLCTGLLLRFCHQFVSALHSR